jgi:hypothetical protein
MVYISSVCHSFCRHGSPLLYLSHDKQILEVSMDFDRQYLALTMYDFSRYELHLWERTPVGSSVIIAKVTAALRFVALEFQKGRI